MSAPLALRLPPLEFVKHECDAYSSISALLFYGPYYSGLVKEVTGGTESIGDVLAFFSQFDQLEDVIRHVHRCCKNRRAGETCAKTGQCFDLYHHGAAISLYQLMLFARQNREYFAPTHPDVNIQIRSADLHKVIRAEQKTTGGRDSRRRGRPATSK